jgi:signal transduction histidine kinase/ActR/RegA family two-component response regulator
VVVANATECTSAGVSSLLTAQNQALELIARDAPVAAILDFVARFIESRARGMRCSVLVLDGDQLRHGAGPSLPQAYIRAIDGVKIGPTAGSCGTAAFTGETVIVEDIAVDPLWANYRELALGHGLRACWSTPILSSRGAVLGTFAMYYPSAGRPQPDQRELVSVATHLTAIAIERHNTRLALERQTEALARANQAKDRFLATLSHELRNPIAPLLIGVHLIRLGKYEPAKVERNCAIVDRQARQLSRLVDDLLDVARITNGKVELSKELVGVRFLINAAREAAVLIDERQHEFTVELSSEPIELCVDPGRMIQVLSNLLNNAAKYTEPGGRLSVLATLVEAEVVIQVADTGQGIEPSRLADIFEPFMQIDRSRDVARGGLGVGLSVARSLVELHGGSIQATSAGPGRGTEITMRLPAFTGPRPQPRPRPQLTTTKRRQRVLVVDDNEDAALLVGESMTMVGHESRVVHDGLTAIAAASEWHPDLILLDIGLPGIDGYEVARRVRSADPDHGIRIVAMSGFGQPADLERGVAAGFDAYLVKPVEFETLVRTVEGVRGPDERDLRVVSE